MIRLAFAAMAAPVIATTLSAQQLSLRLGGLAAQYADSINDQAGSLSVRLTGRGRRTSTLLDASWAQFQDGGGAGQAWGNALLLGNATRNASLGLKLEGLANVIRDGPWSGTGNAGLFGMVFAGAWTFSATASGGGVRMLDGTHSTMAGGDLAATIQGRGWALTATGTGVAADTIRFVDAALALWFRRGPVEAGALIADRRGDLATGAWAQAYLDYAFTSVLALEAAAGSYPRDITGFDRGRYARLGLRVFLHRGRRELDAAGGATVPAPSTAIEVRRIDSARVWVTFKVDSAERVAIAGAWNEWNPVPLMRAADGRWAIDLPLAAGTHRFALVLDGERWTVPAGVAKLPDDFGGEVGLLAVP